ncbi:MAG: membrane protein insertase YidC, partial [Rhodospirillales bacterium]|nr:membrane protein insertase YidC [Rhodospirillales bacterium]
MNSDNRNMFLAVILSALILFGYQYYVSLKYPDAGKQSPQQSEQVSAPGAQTVPPVPAPQASGQPTAPVVPGTGAAIPAQAQIQARAAILKSSTRVSIQTDRLSGSIDLKGGRIDDLTLINYRETLDPDSAKIIMLSPEGTKGAYYIQHGWAPSGNVKVPGPNTQWSADKKTLSADGSVTLSWDNGEGLKFFQIISLDKNYLFTVKQRVANTGVTAVSLSPYGLIARHDTPDVTNFYILHEGPIGVIDGTLKEINYDDLKEENNRVQHTTTGGWLGITDKFWLAALIPDQKAKITTRFSHVLSNGHDKYQTDFISNAPLIAAPGSSVESESHLFAGAKEVKLLDAYKDRIGILNFDKAIDFGWFYFLTKPIFYTLIYIHEHVGNFGVAILLLTVLIKLLFFPLANKSYRAMSKMKKLQPEMKKLQERFKEDKMRLNQEMMALYKREKTNPASGCLPMLIQIPVFFALYKVLFVT